MFVACGLNYKTAPIEVREKIALNAPAQADFLSRLLNTKTVNEAAVLSTCNRTEIYCKTPDLNFLMPWLADEYKIHQDTLRTCLYVYPQEQGLRHALRVASGLDSMMLGEPQILGQMKQAYQQALEIGAIKLGLRPLFEYIFRASKRIRSHSGIGHNSISIAYAAVQLIKQTFPHFRQLNVFIIGSGEMATLVGKYLRQEGVNHFSIASRSMENAQRLAQHFDGSALAITDIPQALPKADIVISATTCPLPFIDQALVRETMGLRQQKPMFFLDLAVPRDVESNVAELAHVHLYNIDDLQIKIEKGLDKRKHAAERAEILIHQEVEQYLRWQNARNADEMICQYRAHMTQLAEEELLRAQQKLTAGIDQADVLKEFGHRLLNKLTHFPSVGLRLAATEQRNDLIDLAQYLFNFSNNHNETLS